MSAVEEEEDGDSAKYTAHLTESRRSDLSDVESTGCVSQGTDVDGNPMMVFIPRIGFGYRDKSEEMLKRMFLLFIRNADEVVTRSYSIVYSHVILSWMDQVSQHPIVFEYYKMLPRHYKKNLQKIYIIHPRMGIKAFFEFARFFLSKKFYEKLVFVDNIADFQKMVAPTQLVLPYQFLRCEDEDKGLKPSGIAIPLHVDFDPIVGTTSIMARCATYLRENGGLRMEGLFRVAGDEMLLTVVKTRLQPAPSSSISHMRSCLRCVVIGRGPSSAAGSVLTSYTGVQGSEKEKRLSMADIETHSVVVIEGLETTAQLLKASLRYLDVPLFTFTAYDSLMGITHLLEKKEIDLVSWYRGVHGIIGGMPVEHSSTVAYLLDFLREVAAESDTNKMGAGNLAVVFSPTVLRPKTQESTDHGKILQELKTCENIVKYLIMMDERDRIRGLTTLLAPGAGGSASKPATHLSDGSLYVKGAGGGFGHAPAGSHLSESAVLSESAIEASMMKAMRRRMTVMPSSSRGGGGAGAGDPNIEGGADVSAESQAAATAEVTALRRRLDLINLVGRDSAGGAGGATSSGAEEDPSWGVSCGLFSADKH